MSPGKPNIRLRANTRTAATGDLGEAVARFEIHYHRCLDAEGVAVGPLPEVTRDPEALIGLYRAMLGTRLFDQKAIKLQRTGQLGTYASSLGQEAIGAALGHCMRPEDVLLPTYREYAAQFLRGVRMSEILLYWGGDERGMDYRGPREDFPICVPIASQCSHAVGVAYAFKLRGQARVAVCVLGDGGTSKGDFYEAINLAGAWQVPVLFVVVNNQWAISLPRERQSAAATLAQKAIAAGIEGEQVDGNDVLALSTRIEQALAQIRSGGAPRLIEALSYRVSDHTTADDARRYRDTEAVEAARRLDPLRRLRRFLGNAGLWDEHRDRALQEECATEVERAVQTYRDTPPQAPEAMFDYLFQSLPQALEKQRAGLGSAEADND